MRALNVYTAPFARIPLILLLLTSVWLEQIFLCRLGIYAPALTPAVFFYWAIYRERPLSALLLIAIGLYQDLFIGTPLGLSASLYILLYWGARAQRQSLVLSSFLTVWCVFGACSLLLYGGFWIALSLLNGCALPLYQSLYVAAFATALYPALVRAFTFLHQIRER